MTTRKLTEEEINSLYEHLQKKHNIDTAGANLLSHHKLPFSTLDCEHDYQYIYCVFCSLVVITAISFENLDKEHSCSCVTVIPNDISEIIDAQ